MKTACFILKASEMPGWKTERRRVVCWLYPHDMWVLAPGYMYQFGVGVESEAPAVDLVEP